MSDKKQEQLDRLAALRKRKVQSTQANREDVRSVPDKATAKLQAKQDQLKERAQMELSKLELGEEEFERRRAWDWTVEESEAWDAKLQNKKERASGGTFSDYSTAAEKTYLKEIRELKPIVGSHKIGKDTNGKPPKEAIDRLVNKLKKDDIERLSKRNKRREQEDDGQVNYINEKNKQFNKKLERHYDKYTKEIRDSFERGTAL